MPLKDYSAIRGVVIDRRIGAGNGKYHIHVGTNTDHFRVTVNTKSRVNSIIRYYMSIDYSHPITDRLGEIDWGINQIDRIPNGLALDYIREHLVNESEMITIPTDLLGAHTIMNDILDGMLIPAMSEASSIFLFGERWGPTQIMDSHFGFFPSNGIHNVHMNQGSEDDFTQDNGVYQDGGLFINDNQSRWLALFISFESQTWKTHELMGHSIESSHPNVRIASALINPKKRSMNKKTITIINNEKRAFDVNGWKLSDGKNNTISLDGIVLKPSSKTCITNSTSRILLPNMGGIITLLDANGVKVDGVFYTREQSSYEGVELVWPDSVEASDINMIPYEDTEQVFLSYSRKNSQFAMGLAQELKLKGFRVWIDQMSIPGGVDWNQSIDKGIRQSNNFIVVLSKASVKSEQVGSEIQFAFDERKPIFPIIYENCDIPRILRRLQIVNFESHRENVEKPLKELISAMRKKKSR